MSVLQQQRPQRPATSSRAITAACCAALFIYAVYLGALSVILPYIGVSFHLGSAVEGRLFPTTFGGFIVGVLASGNLSDRYGRKLVLAISIGGYAAALALFGASASFNIVLVASVLVGASTGAMETVASALASDLYPNNRAAVINLLQIAFGVGAGLGPLISHPLLEHGIDWRTLYFVLAAASAAVCLTVLAQRFPAIPHAPEALDWAALKGVAGNPIFLMLCACQMLYVASEVSLFSWMPTYFRTNLQGAEGYAGIVVALFWLMMTIGRIATAAALTRVPLMRLVITLSAAGAVFAALTLLATPPLIVLVLVSTTGLCFSGIFGLVLAEAGEMFPAISGTVFGAVVASGGVGGALLPWLIGAAAEHGLGWHKALMAIPICVALIVLLSRRIEATSRRNHAI